MTDRLLQIGLTQKEILFLSLEVDGFSNVEIGQRFNLSISSVRKTKKRGREKLESHGLCLPVYRQEKRPTVISVDFA